MYLHRNQGHDLLQGIQMTQTHDIFYAPQNCKLQRDKCIIITEALLSEQLFSSMQSTPSSTVNTQSSTANTLTRK